MSLKIGIIGGGIMGLATAFYLSEKGHQITILEKDSEIGGLSRSELFLPDFRWDRFYHVILSTDKELLKFIQEIGLSLDVDFKETKTGFFTNGRLHSMSNTLEFLKFKPLNLFDKIRLGLGILYASKKTNWELLEKKYAKTWLIQVFGRRNYEKIWHPLLRSKFGAANSLTSGAFIWAAIKRYYGTRHKGSKKEMMGCVKDGYHSILKKVKIKLSERGVKILLNSEVYKLESLSNKKLQVHMTSDNSLNFDRVVATIPNPQILRILPDTSEEFRSILEKTEYLSIVCLTLLIERPLCPFYVTNITDDGFSFTGVIDASNIIDEKILKGRGLVYLPRYMPVNDPFYNKKNEDISEIFIKEITRIFPDFSKNKILAIRVNRESYVQPIQKINYSKYVPPMLSPLKNFFMVNTTMIMNSTLNNNEVIRLSRRAAEIIV